MTATMASEQCKTCHKTHPWPDGTMPRNPFNDGLMGASATLGTRPGKRTAEEREAVEPNLAPWPFDPVLRQALMDKGVLTPQDLRDAEIKIRAVTASFEGGPGGSDSQSGSGG